MALGSGAHSAFQRKFHLAMVRGPQGGSKGGGPEGGGYLGGGGSRGGYLGGLPRALRGGSRERSRGGGPAGRRGTSWIPLHHTGFCARPGGIALAAPIKYSFHVNGALLGYKIVFKVRFLPGDIVLCKKRINLPIGRKTRFFSFFFRRRRIPHISRGGSGRVRW